MESFLQSDASEEPSGHPEFLSYDSPPEIDRSEILRTARDIAVEFCERCGLLIFACGFAGLLAAPFIGVDLGSVFSVLLLYVLGLIYWFIAIGVSCWIRLRLTTHELKLRHGSWLLAAILIVLPWPLWWILPAPVWIKSIKILISVYAALPWTAGALMFQQCRRMNER